MRTYAFTSGGGGACASAPAAKIPNARTIVDERRLGDVIRGLLITTAISQARCTTFADVIPRRRGSQGKA
jgi:hypothetical protein